MLKVGIIGGGQLGRMMILDAKRLGINFIILDPTPNCPASSISDEQIIANFDDVEAIKLLASKVDVVTYEFEHISVDALKILEENWHKVYPSSQTLFKIQNKYYQKECLKQFNIPVPDFKRVTNIEDIKEVSKTFNYPLILKTCTGGYDGKGNAVIKSEEDIKSAFDILGSGKVPLMVEKFINFEKEISILACRSTNGDLKLFPIAENTHLNSILDETVVPANISDITKQKAMKIAENIIVAFECYGMICIELFVTMDGDVLVNELAPRPHNSGHYTIEGCMTSQFEQHIRAILGLPLGSTRLITPIVMKNIIGEDKGSGEYEGLEFAYNTDNVKVHMYGKEKVSKGRKMGHIVAFDDDIKKAIKDVRQAFSYIKFK